MIGQDEAAEIVALGEYVQALEVRLGESAAHAIAARAAIFSGEHQDPYRVRLELRIARAALARAALALVGPLRETTCPQRVQNARDRLSGGDLLTMMDI